MLYGRYTLQEGENGFQISVGHVSEATERHQVVQFPYTAG
jgi:hypothetical protein